MTLQFENEQEYRFPFDCEQIADLVVNQVLDVENCPYEAEVSLTLTDNQEIHRLNMGISADRQTYRCIVLSAGRFSGTGADYQVLEEEGWEDCF